ncbi:MAG: MATE family efflux transporter [Lachnospiraceae bacterium]|nr:MATE family efflux transporter [Lachnospiraceae bacterium]
MNNEKTLMNLFWPCFFEVLFLMLAGMIDTFMLSGLNDKAVGAVGTANTYLSILVIMFSIISSGMVAVMTQYIGAKQNHVAKQAKNLGLILNLFLGILLSLALGIFAKEILTFMGTATTLLSYATTYTKIIGGSCVLVAILPIYNSYLRCFGYTKIPMYATISSNILNLLLNGLFLYVLRMGVAGVAIATVISRIVNLIVLVVCSERYIKIHSIRNDDEEEDADYNIKHNDSDTIMDNTSITSDATTDNNTITNNNNDYINIDNVSPRKISNRELLLQILKVGVPAAAETALYNLSMTIIIKFLNQMDPDGINVTARAYVSTITNFSYCAGVALASANAILLGWNIGKHNYNKCYKDTNRALKYGLITALTISGLIFILARPILSLFTSNNEIITLATTLLFVDIFLELGRVMNLIFANALKTAGDAVYIVIVASIIMLLVGAGGTYILGIELKLLALGAYISMALDEIIRGFISYHRFHSKKWEEKTLV